jgi:phospholipid/cholesterol/gamma-HCH transport system permease protein
MAIVAGLGRTTIGAVAEFGDFCRFSGRALQTSLTGMRRWRYWARLLPQMFEVGTRSIPVVMITGAFVGMVLAVQTITQFRVLGMEGVMGSVVNKSVLRELGPVLAGIMLAGRVGGGLTAELGTMHVTEQIDALRAMGADPIETLVVPRFLAALLLVPLLTVYADFTGILGGLVVSVYVYGVSAGDFWSHAQDTVTYWDVFYGIIKSFLFGGVMSLVCCYKGFRCSPGAAGVGSACTQSFVASCMAILGINFLLGMFLNTLYERIYGGQSVFF